MTPIRHLRATLLSLACSALVVSCGGGEAGREPTNPGPAPVAVVSIEPESATVQPARAVTYFANPRDAGGNVLYRRAVTWSSADTTIAIVSAFGEVTGRREGRTQVSATSEGRTGRATIVVRSVLAVITLSSTSVTVAPGQQAAITATPKDSGGVALAGRALTWVSSDTSVATVSTNGVIAARREGQTQITVSAEGRSATAAVVVRIPVASVTLSSVALALTPAEQVTVTATARDADGTTLAGRPIAWTSNDTTIAAVTAGGVVTARRVGRGTITATSEGRSAVATVVVALPIAARVTLALPYPQLVVGMSEKLTVVAYDGGGAPILGAPIVLSSSDTSVARIDSVGRLRVFRAGSATITATSGSARATASVSSVLAATTNPAAHVTEIFPTVFDSTGTAGVDLLYEGPSIVTAVELRGVEVVANSAVESTIPLMRIPETNRWVVTLSAAQVRARRSNCGCGRPSAMLGTIRATSGSSVLLTRVVNVNLRIGAEVPLTEIDTRTQTTTHVINIRMDSSDAEGTQTPTIQRVYDRYGDAFDFVVRTNTATLSPTLSFDGVQSQVRGIGLCCWNGLARFGRPGLRRLLGEIRIPARVTIVGEGLAHEVGHAFMVGSMPLNEIGTVPWAAGHFALGSMALGIMGNGGPNNQFVLTPTGSSTWRVDNTTPRVPGFLDVELYFMGLIPIDSVGTHFVFRNQAQSFALRATLAGPIDTVHNTDIVRLLGPRSPAWPNAQRAFTAARVIVSRGRLLSPAEMAWYDQDAREAEGRTEIVSPEGKTAPFYLHTGGRATIQFRLP